jgi:hypothetical protein
MFVDTGLLHSGASASYTAGSHAQAGAVRLSGTAPLSGMFGDFAAAQAFNEAVASAHAHHVKTLQTHQENLRALGDNAQTVARTFTTTDDHNAAALRAVRCSSDT